MKIRPWPPLRLAICLALVLGVGCDRPAPPKPQAPNAASTTNAPTNGVSPKHFLWEVTKNGRSHFIMGTIHVGNAQTFPLPKAIDQAFAQCQRVALEIDMTFEKRQEAALKMAIASFGTDQPNLEQRFDKATAQTIRTKAMFAGLPDPDRMAPWALYLFLDLARAQSHGYSAQLGIDLYLLQLALHDHKPVMGLETFEEQTEALSAIPPKDMDRLIGNIIRDWDEGQALMSTLFNHWRHGHVEAMDKIIQHEMGRPEFAQVYKHLLIRRNKNWIPDLEKIFASDQTTLVAVGSAHLVGPQSVLELLEKKGYQITQR